MNTAPVARIGRCCSRLHTNSPRPPCYYILYVYTPPQGGGWNGKYWKALDVRYDQCVGNCECLPERDMPEDYFSVHFSCIQVRRREIREGGSISEMARAN